VPANHLGGKRRKMCGGAYGMHTSIGLIV
jgi:hypothetical protein